MFVKWDVWALILDMFAIYIYKRPVTIMPEHLVTMIPTVASKLSIRGWGRPANPLQPLPLAGWPLIRLSHIIKGGPASQMLPLPLPHQPCP